MKTVLSIPRKERSLIEKYYNPLIQKLNKYEVIVTETVNEKRIYFSFSYASVNKVSVIKILRAFLCAVYCVSYKRKFIEEGLSDIPLPIEKKEVLLQTLVCFNREEEFVLVGRGIDLSARFAIDGHYNFKMSMIKDSWEESIVVTHNNCDLLMEDRSFNLLLRFLLSTVEPKSETVTIEEDGERLSLLAESGKVTVTNEKDALLALIDIAPVEVYYPQEPQSNRLFCRLREIFEVKDGNNGYSFV